MSCFPFPPTGLVEQSPGQIGKEAIGGPPSSAEFGLTTSDPIEECSELVKGRVADGHDSFPANNQISDQGSA